MVVHEMSATGGLDTPLGPLRVVATERGVVEVSFAPPGAVDGLAVAEGPGARHVADALRQLREYLGGHRRSFELTLTPRGTPFQLAVWAALQQVPFGSTTSYGAIARAVGRPTASRAVGAANGRNPLAIVVPCHRILGADGSLTGYGGGLDRKRWLLELERGAAASAAG